MKKTDFIFAVAIVFLTILFGMLTEALSKTETSPRVSVSESKLSK